MEAPVLPATAATTRDPDFWPRHDRRPDLATRPAPPRWAGRARRLL